MFRSNTYTEGSFYTLIPLSRQAVVPGQSVSIDLEAIWETPAFNRNVLSGGRGAVMAFYVPYRLLWDEWVEFISDPQSTAVVPSSSVDFAPMFENAADAQTVWGRRAYKLIYNQYFGSNQFPGSDTWYEDIADDDDNVIKRTRTLDQFLGRLMPQSEAPDRTYAAPVSGTSPNEVATISLNDFRQAMKNARSSRRSDLTGDKYVDAMRRMGVALDWRIQQAPEYLGGQSFDFDAKETRSSYTPADPAPAGSSVTGRAYARFNEKVRAKTPRRFFAEHGLVVTVLVIRPVVFQVQAFASADAYQVQRDGYFLGDNQTGVTPVTRTQLGAGTGQDYYSSRFLYLRAGQNLIGAASAQPWSLANQGTDIAQYIWPVVTVPQDTVIANEVAVFTRYTSSGPTPVQGSTV